LYPKTIPGHFFETPGGGFDFACFGFKVWPARFCFVDVEYRNGLFSQ